MNPFERPRKGSGSSSKSPGEGRVALTPEESRKSGGSRSSEGKSPPQPIWVPEIKGPDGSGFGLNPKIDNSWKFSTGMPEWL
eukprot:s659_g9.t1